MKRYARIGIRVGALLLVAACSQSALETYGCACEGRAYTKDEIARYRAAAAMGDLKGLAEMEEYYGWRASLYLEGTPDYEAQMQLVQHYRDALISRDDQRALREQVDILLWDAEQDKARPADRLKLLQEARTYTVRLHSPYAVFDWENEKRGLDDEHNMIDARAYIDREIAALKRGAAS